MRRMYIFNAAQENIFWETLDNGKTTSGFPVIHPADSVTNQSLLSVAIPLYYRPSYQTAEFLFQSGSLCLYANIRLGKMYESISFLSVG